MPSDIDARVFLAVMPEDAFFVLMAIKALAAPDDHVRITLGDIHWTAQRLKAGRAPFGSYDGPYSKRAKVNLDRAMHCLMIYGWVDNIRHKSGTANTYRLLRPVPPLQALQPGARP